MSTPTILKVANEAAFVKITPKNHGVVMLGDTIRLACGRVHEVLGNAADTLAIAAAAQTKGRIIWIARRRGVETLAPAGFQQFLDPTRILTVHCMSRQEILWAAEQSLRILKSGCIVIELDDGPDLKESRRLQVMAEEGGALGIILIAGRAQTSAAQTRWYCEALPNEETPWVWRLIKNKSGEINAWRVCWRCELGNGETDDASSIVLMAATAAA